MTVRWIDDIADGEERDVGKKGAALATVSQHGMQVPRGFVVTAQTFESFVRQNGLENQIESILNSVDRTDVNSVRRAANRIHNLVMGTELSADTRETIEEAYEKINLSEEVRNAGGDAVDLVGSQRETEFVAVRSSPTGSRIPGAHNTELNVNGKTAVVQTVKECWASLYSAEALSMENAIGNVHSMAVIVQRMVEADVSGAAFGWNPVDSENDEYVIESVWGLGSALYNGSSTPDRFIIDKSTTVRQKDIAEKEWKIIRDPTSGKNIKQRVSQDDRNTRSLSYNEIESVVDALQQVDARFGRPVRMDFVLSRNRLYLLDVEQYRRDTPEEPQQADTDAFIRGRGASSGTGQGQVQVLYSDTDIERVEPDNVIVSVNASERLIPMLSKAAAFVADKGGIASNVATLSRMLDVPCIVGIGNATDMLTRGDTVTVNGGSGSIREGEHTVQEPVDEQETAVTPAMNLSDTLTATRVKVLGSQPAEQAEGAVIPEYVDYSSVVDAAENHRPNTVWARTQGVDAADRENVNLLTSHMDENMAGKGTILSTYGGVMRSTSLFERGAAFVGLDVDALKNEGDTQSLINSIEKLGEEARTGCEAALLLQQVDRTVVEKAVESGIDAVVVPPERVDEAKMEVAKAEKRFMLNKLREL